MFTTAPLDLHAIADELNVSESILDDLFEDDHFGFGVPEPSKLRSGLREHGPVVTTAPIEKCTPTVDPWNDMLDLVEASEVLGMDRQTLYLQVRSGQIPASQFGAHRKIYLTRQAVEDLLAQRKAKARGEVEQRAPRPAAWPRPAINETPKERTIPVGTPVGLDDLTDLHRLAMQSDDEQPLATALNESEVCKRIDARLPNGYRPLHCAARVNNAKGLALLLGHGAWVHAPDEFGWTAMHHASALGHLDAVLQLIAHGAIADQAANDGRTVLDLAGNRNVHAVLAATLGR